MNGLPEAAEKPPEPLPNITVTVLALEFAVAKSSFPSLLKSPAATAAGALPIENGLPEAPENVPAAFG